MLFALRCPGCRGPARGVCSRCRAAVTGVPLSLDTWSLSGVDGGLALAGYEGAIRRLVLAAKNGGRRDLAGDLGRALAVAVDAAAVGPFQGVAWVPASTDGRRRRGYDQGRLLARAAAGHLGVRSTRLLIRSGGSGLDRRGLGRVDRLAGPPIRAVGRCPSRILLVDDVLTTGGSVAASAAALRAAGADLVFVAAVAAARADGRAGPQPTPGTAMHSGLR